MNRKEEIFSEMIEKTKGAFALSIQGTFDYAFEAVRQEVWNWVYRTYENTDEKRKSEFIEGAPVKIFAFLDSLTEEIEEEKGGE